MSEASKMDKVPLYIQVQKIDNVAIIVDASGLPSGTVFPSGLVLREHVPQGHKVSLVDLAKDAPIIRYGEVIGYAVRAIPSGSWVEGSLVRMPDAPSLDHLPLATKVPAAQPPLEGFTFEGYRNADGTVGSKNLLGISISVQCVAGIVEHAVRRIRQEILPRYPNVDGVVELDHTYGCGVAIEALGADIPIRTLRNIARHPNFGGAPMVVSLGCEKMVPEWLLSEQRPATTAGSGVDIVQLQDERHHGFDDMITSIMAMAEQHLAGLNERKRVTCPASDLVVGMKCGGSDAFSGVTANPAVGFASDLLVRAGATVMFTEVTEVRDAIAHLTARAIDEDVARALVREMAWYDAYLQQGGADRSANTTPGNHRGGLANIVEKALGSVAKSGTSAISGVLAPGRRADRKGLLFAASPASDFISGTLLFAAGMTVQVFTTGRGTPYGLEAVPVIKMSTRKALTERWYDLIDLDAGRIATGEATIEEVGWELFHLILDVASGRKQTWADHWGLHNALTLFNPGPVT
jgi:galactarate dehydratase